MNTNRRKFLTSTSALTASALAGNLGTWGVESANAQAATGYKAMVCVFLFGGNDSNNMIMPYTDYAQYSAGAHGRRRTSRSRRRSCSSSTRRARAKAYGFHPSMAPLAPVYAAGKIAVIANSGTLIAPITKAQYNARMATGRRTCSRTPTSRMRGRACCPARRCAPAGAAACRIAWLPPTRAA